MKTTQRGRAAESLVAAWLEDRGYKILTKNWRARTCEIDIVATKGGVAYLVEVKYRGSAAQGEGLSYITPAKLRQMRRAAQVWAQFESWDGDCRLMAASVDGRDGKIQTIGID